MSEVKVNKISPRSGTGVQLGDSGDTITIPAGATLANAGTVTGIPASAISSGTIATARLGSGTASGTTFLAGDQTYKEAGGGKILQVVYASTTAEKVVSSATFVDSGLSASITPSATSSKVLIICEIASCGKASSNTRVVLKLLKGSSDLITFAQEVGETQSTNANKVGNSGCTFLDSPNTTSSTTYKVQMNSGAGTSYAQTGGSGATSTMTLMEVAG